MRIIDYRHGCDTDSFYICSSRCDNTAFSKAIERYIKGDLEMTRDLWEKRKPLTNKQIGDICQEAYDRFAKRDSKIVKVIFNDPATIVFWRDNTKTVVKCDPTEQFDPEKGLAMAIAKKALGNKGNYFKEIKKWVDPYESEWWNKKLAEINKTIDEEARRLPKRTLWD